MNFLTRFEEADIIGIRATELANGDHPRVDPGDCDDDLRIALMELRAGKLGDWDIRTYKPNGQHQDRKVRDLRQRDASQYALMAPRPTQPPHPNTYTP